MCFETLLYTKNGTTVYKRTISQLPKPDRPLLYVLNHVSLHTFHNSYSLFQLIRKRNLNIWLLLSK